MVKETMGPEGWKNYDSLWPKKRGYKKIMAITEAPNGEVWSAWIPKSALKHLCLPEVTASNHFPMEKPINHSFL